MGSFGHLAKKKNVGIFDKDSNVGGKMVNKNFTFSSPHTNAPLRPHWGKCPLNDVTGINAQNAFFQNFMRLFHSLHSQMHNLWDKSSFLRFLYQGNVAQVSKTMSMRVMEIEIYVTVSVLRMMTNCKMAP